MVRPIRWLSRLFICVLLLAGCAIVDGVEKRRTRRLERRGVSKHHVELGADHLGYWKGGRGDETIVLLHGFGANALFQWYPQMRELSRHYRVIAPDLLWFGESRSASEDFTVQHQARAVARLLDHEGVDRVHVVGLSYGGMVTHELVSMIPDRVDRVVLVSSPARAFLASDKRRVFEEMNVDSAEDLLLPQDPEGLARLMSLAYDDPPWVPSFVAREILARFYVPRREQHRRMLHAVEQSTELHRSEREIPTNDTLIIWGANDKVFPEQAAWRLRGELGDVAQVCVLPNAAHAPQIEHHDAIIELISDFLAGNDKPCRFRQTALPVPTAAAAKSSRG